MPKPEMNETLPWSFAGYRLISANVKCDGSRVLKKFSFDASNFRMEELFLFDLTLRITGSKMKGTLVFECAFSSPEEIKVDTESDDFHAMIANMSFLVIPYIRQTLTSLTNDSFKPIALPTISSIGFDPVEGQTYVRRPVPKK